MSTWETAVQELGEQMGMQGLSLSSNGRFAIQMASGRRIAAEIAGDGLLLYASDPVPYDGAKRLLRAWRRTYLTSTDGRPVQAALREQDGLMRLLVVVRLHADERSPYTLRVAIDHVSSWLDDTCTQ